MASVLVAWINERDAEASGPGSMSESRILRVVADEFYAHVYLLSAHKKTGRNFKKWLAGQVTASVEVDRVKVANIYDYAEVWDATLQALQDCRNHVNEDEIEWSFLLGADSAVMDAVMIHLANTQINAELLQWSRAEGNHVIDVNRDAFPLATRVELPPAPAEEPSEPELVTVFQASANLDLIEHHSAQMTAVHQHAHRLASMDVPILLTGEAGTGRELIARAIHKASRRNGAFVAVDCEALEPDEQADALFGPDGLLKQASGGTLLLDAVDHLAPSVQAWLHRAIRDGRAASVRQPLDVRIMATANGTAASLLAEGRLREDLFHAIAIGILHVPPLRERPEDVGPFIDRVLGRIEMELGHAQKLTPAALEFVLDQRWYGNNRELEATLRRAAVLTDHDIDVDHIRASLFVIQPDVDELPEGFDVQFALDETARNYLRQALALSDGNKTQAARRLGLNNYQTLSNWMRRLGLNDSDAGLP